VTSDEIRRLIETQGVELKKPLKLKREGLKSLNAMVNADTAEGTVVFGVAPNGAIVGVEPGNLDKAQRSLAQHVRSKFSPPIQFEIEVVDCDQKWVVVVRGKRGSGVPLCEYDGRAFIQEGSESRQLQLAEKRDMIRRRNRGSHPGPWRCDRCNSFVGTLSSGVTDGVTMKRTYRCSCGGEYWPVT